MSFYRVCFPNGKLKALTFSYDDGVPQDQRLAEIFDKYHIKATFNFSGKGFYFSKEEIQNYFLARCSAKGSVGYKDAALCGSLGR